MSTASNNLAQFPDKKPAATGLIASRIELTPAGLAWTSLENENACLRNELAVLREHCEKLELEKLAIVRAHCDLLELHAELKSYLDVYVQWAKDRAAGRA